MRSRRLKVSQNAWGTYHCISRVVGGERLLGPRDREILRRQMRQMAGFSGVTILTYCILSNHFHILVRVPPKRQIDDTELVKRFAILYGSDEAAVLAKNLESSSRAPVIRDNLLNRMHDISFFIKELKMRFSIYFNKTHNRFGTLWAERFKSLLVENDDRVLRAVAAYIDLNPVRAGLCKDPKDYRFCGYAEATGGSPEAREGIREILKKDRWSQTARDYRVLLFGTGVYSDRSKEGGINWEASRTVLDNGGALPLSVLLRCRLRYMSDGLVLGSANFVMDWRRNLAPADFDAKRRPGGVPRLRVDGEEALYFVRRQRWVK